MTPIKYIGHRAIYKDGACGSELTFAQGQTLAVDDEAARKMLRHPSVYETGNVEDIGAEVVVAKNKSTTDEDPDQTTRDAIANMNKEALVTYAKVHFSSDLDKRRSVADLRTQVTGLFDQFGTN